jgi:1,4-alpha-glucan branching enzyme
MVTKAPGRGGKVRVTFSVPAHLWADSIHLVGDFNGWDKRATPLRLTEAGWKISIELEAGKSYQYRYLIDGREWHNDWQADAYATNQFGGDNSVVIAPFFAEPQERRAPPATPQLWLVSSR